VTLRAVLLDVEGVTTSIRFVKDVLFPFARQALPRFLATHAHEGVVAGLVDELRRSEGLPVGTDVAPLLLQWIDEDRKHTVLKALQGLVWADGYDEGILTGHVYEDILRTLRAWREAGLRVGIYSSGSVQGQRGLFAHTRHGDLSPLIRAWFDTRVGPKKRAASYLQLSEAWGLSAAEILFLSDDEGELDAASEAGCAVVLVRRHDAEGPRQRATAQAREPAPESRHRTVTHPPDCRARQ